MKQAERWPREGERAAEPGEMPLTASSIGFPKENTREVETREKCERQMMGMSVERERGVMGRKRRFLLVPSFQSLETRG